MAAHWADGQPEKAIRAYQKTRAAWQAEFGPQARLMAETTDLNELILSQTRLGAIKA